MYVSAVLGAFEYCGIYLPHAVLSPLFVKQPSHHLVSKCLKVMEDALERFPESCEVLLFFAEVRSRSLERKDRVNFCSSAGCHFFCPDLQRQPGAAFTPTIYLMYHLCTCLTGFGQPWRLCAGLDAAKAVIVAGTRLSAPVRECRKGLPRNERPSGRSKVTSHLPALAVS